MKHGERANCSNEQRYHPRKVLRSRNGYAGVWCDGHRGQRSPTSSSTTVSKNVIAVYGRSHAASCANRTGWYVSRWSQARKEARQNKVPQLDPVQQLEIRVARRICRIIYAEGCACARQGGNRCCDTMKSAAQHAFAEIRGE